MEGSRRLPSLPGGHADDLGLGTERWVRIREAARIGGVDPRTIRRWADSGKIRARVTPGGHRQVSVEGLGQAYVPAQGSRGNLEPVEVDPDVAIPQWSAAAVLWHLWRPHRRLSEEALTELRLESESLRRSLTAFERVASEELAARDRRATADRSFTG